MCGSQRVTFGDNYILIIVMPLLYLYKSFVFSIGSGKTWTGVHIATWFANMNSLKPDSTAQNAPVKKVLYCGPSNRSVDVVAGWCPT